MTRLVSAAFLILFGLFLHAPPSLAQQEHTDGARKIVSWVMPRYPEMARTMNIRGSVKAEALVKPNGVANPST
jgi:outer membrane biosynthesis protein TonB